MKRRYTGINIQYPISRLILSGQKTIETRTYPLPKEYIGKEMALVETPGKDGTFKARIVATIIFSESYQYSSKQDFYKDTHLHKVTPNSQWAWTKEKKKWAWPIEQVNKLDSFSEPTKRKGIIFTKNLSI